MQRFAATTTEGYRGCCEALAGADLRPDLHRIQAPLLAISGDDDPVCTPADLQHIADGVADGRHVSLPGRHIVNVESAPAFNAALVDFLRPCAAATTLARAFVVRAPSATPAIPPPTVVIPPHPAIHPPGRAPPRPSVCPSIYP